MADYKVGDIVNGHVLTPEMTWAPVPAAPPPPPPVAVAPPPPPAPPAPPQAPPPSIQPTYGMPQFSAPQMPAPPVGYQAPSAPAPVYAVAEDDGIDFTTEAWTSGMPLGRGFIVRIDDIEAGVSQNNNAKLTFSGVTLQPNGNIGAGFKAVWSYTLTDKARGKLGKDLVAMGLGHNPNHPKGRYPDPSKSPSALGAALLAVLRGQTVVVDSVESNSSTSDLPNVSIVGLHAPQAQTNGVGTNAAPISVGASAPAAPPPGAAPAVSFPSGPPTFGNV